jgi:hypothetical protein
VKCDNLRHTITIIETTNVFIFGGYTPLSWNSINNSKRDDSLKSFIFTLKNAPNTGPKRCSLEPDKKHPAIYCSQASGPVFGGGNDFCIDTNSNATAFNYAKFGHSYDNHAGSDGQTFLA